MPTKPFIHSLRGAYLATGSKAQENPDILHAMQEEMRACGTVEKATTKLKADFVGQGL